jgi:hypothetical protein
MMAKRMIRDLVLRIRPVSLFGGQYESDSNKSDGQSSDEREDNSSQGMSSRLSLSDGVDANSPAGVIGSPATPQTDETEPETAKDKIRRLERENLKLKQTIIEVKDRSFSMIVNKKGTMKLGGKHPPDYGGKDALNCTYANDWAVDYFRRVKFIGDGLGQYSEDEGSMCQRILKCGIQIPDDCNPEQYYYTCVAKMVLFKIRILKTNFMTVGREAFMSEYYLMC